ncbi:MAG TPA: hypothetical protein VLJ68_12100 [Chitinophagaceae bacterium]|nr:hypothetical protein [Chitinophagaceae bacterium]
MKRILFAGLLVIILAPGCETSSFITSSWKAPDKQPREYKKILVLGLIGGNDRSVREKMEEHIVGDLKMLGYDAVCSCEEFEPRKFDGMSEKEALARLTGSGIDAVLTVVLLDKKKEKYYTPGRIDYSSYSYYNRNFWEYFNATRNRINNSGYYTTDTKYFWESNFYDLTAAQTEILYSAQSQSFNPASTASLGHEYGQMIVKDMQKNNVLSMQAPKRLKPM